MKTRVFLTERDVITRNENNLVDLRLDGGESYEGLEPRRLFPVRMADKFITLLSEEGEVAVIRDLSELSPESRAVIRASLDDYYLVPTITRIISAADKYGTLRWTVETDRGIRSFDIRNQNHDIRISKDGKVRVRDADDNRYVIPDYKKLDPHSRAKLIIHT
jgi:hypothetical protein